jgi:hypothetical protein
MPSRLCVDGVRILVKPKVKPLRALTLFTSLPPSPRIDDSDDYDNYYIPLLRNLYSEKLQCLTKALISVSAAEVWVVRREAVLEVSVQAWGRSVTAESVRRRNWDHGDSMDSARGWLAGW